MWGRVKGAFSAAKAFASLGIDIGRDNEPDSELMAAMTDELDINNGAHSTHVIESDELRKSSKVKIAWDPAFLTAGAVLAPRDLWSSQDCDCDSLHLWMQAVSISNAIFGWSVDVTRFVLVQLTDVNRVVWKRFID
jgi:hypothetical protein